MGWVKHSAKAGTLFMISVPVKLIELKFLSAKRKFMITKKKFLFIGKKMRHRLPINLLGELGQDVSFIIFNETCADVA